MSAESAVEYRRTGITGYAVEGVEARATIAQLLSVLAGYYAYVLDEGLIERSPGRAGPPAARE